MNQSSCVILRVAIALNNNPSNLLTLFNILRELCKNVYKLYLFVMFLNGLHSFNDVTSVQLLVIYLLTNSITLLLMPDKFVQLVNPNKSDQTVRFGE